MGTLNEAMQDFMDFMSTHTSFDDFRAKAEADIQEDLWAELEQDLYSGTTVEQTPDDEDGEYTHFSFPIEELKKHYRLEKL